MTTSTSPSKELKRDHQTAFRPIGEAAAATDALKGDDDDEHAQMQVEGQQEKQARVKADNDEELEHPVESIESLCMQCGENGTTRLLLTMIPYFKEVIIMSFRCPHCGFHNNEIQPAGSIQELGSVYTVKCTIREDLNRQLVKSQFATLTIPEYELTLPPGKGQLTTIESIITHTIEDLEFEQPVRQHTLPDLYAKIEDMLNKLRPIVADSMADDKDKLEKTFTVKLDDPSGNSFIEARGGFEDPKWSKREYKRTPEQNEFLGLEGKAAEGDDATAASATAAAARASASTVNAANEKTLTDDYVDKPEDVYSFPDICSSCGAHLETFMKTVDIPHFKEVVLMSTNCHSCGYRDNEIKSGGAIAPKGRKITLKVEDTEDLTRDILKSETAGLTIPEIDLHLQPGTLGGRFTTLEGLLNQVYEELDERAFAKGDAAVREGASEIELFLAKLKKVREVLMPYTIILDDPLNNSYIQNLYAPDDDPNMEVEVYERSYEQNEDLGLNDIKVEGYEGEEEARKAREEDDARIAAQAAASGNTQS